MSDLNIGIVGLGWVAGAHIEAFKNVEGARVTAVCSRREHDSETLEATYGLRFRKRRSMDSALMYQAVASSEVDVISAFSTDGRIQAFDLRLVRDDRGVIPPYDAIVLVGPSLARERPEVLDALRALSGRIDASRMQSMNYAVDEEGRAPAVVAAEFLDEFEERKRPR